MTQIWINKNDRVQTYMTLVFCRTILPNAKDNNAIQDQIICSYLYTVNAQELSGLTELNSVLQQ